MLSYSEQGPVKPKEEVEFAHHVVDAESFRNDLISWGRMNFRPFPWRFTTDPYQILIAEVMLHRTQASQVAPVYSHFLEKYPALASLAKVTREEIHEALYSLGLRWRIELIMGMVSQINERFDGQIPEEKSELLSLPGVSDYVASAVRCFAWNKPDAIVDTNTVRVVGRIFNMEIKDSSRRNAVFRRLIISLVDRKHPRAYNFALLDLAAQICTKAQKPLCSVCPVRNYCLFYKQTIGK